MIETFALPHTPALHAYVPGTQPEGEGWVKLNTNELPYPCSPKVGEAIAREIDRLPLYPNPQSLALREAIAKHHGLHVSQVIVGNGSDDVLNLLARCFCDNGHAAGMTLPSYSLYPVLSAIQDAPMEQIPFGEEMSLPVDAILNCRANLFYFTSPNAPTGVSFPLSDIRRAVEGFRGIFVIDEAYADFAGRDAIELLADHPNVVITRTFSKSYGLAGLRVGYAVGSPEVIGLLDRVRDSYNVNRLSQAGALAALQDQAYYTPVIEKVKRSRDKLIEDLRDLGWFVYDSEANFVFARPLDAQGRHGPDIAVRFFEHLRGDRILVRYLKGNPLTESFLRITVGTPGQMARLLESIDQWLKNA